MAGGRPTKYSEELARRICIHVEHGATLDHAAQAEGIPVRTVYDWNAKRPEFSLLVERAKARCITENVKNMTLAANRGSVEAIKWILEHRGGSEYRQIAKQIEVAGPNGGPIQSAVTIYVPHNNRD